MAPGFFFIGAADEREALAHFSFKLVSTAILIFFILFFDILFILSF